ncbi:MAG: sulfotransferase domain-containing protein [Kiloniellales bacterium]|nr:sulfotransferase domain-containing protein [Kiloniellales bacterium]
MSTALSQFLRELILLVLFFLPESRKVRIERWIRGRDELAKLKQADCVIVSYGKSGRTWLRVMISRVYQLKHGLAERQLITFDNMHRRNTAVPKILFSHDNYIKDYTGNGDSKKDYYGKKVVLLARDPADVAVSQFFQWKFRMRRRKKALNAYPTHGEDISLYDFVMRPESGLPNVIKFMNLWAEEADKFEDFLVVRYEDMRKDPKAVLGRIMDFIGTPASDAELAGAVAFASIENMKKMEQKKVFWLSGSRMKPGDSRNPQSFKVRRAKVGGYRDYFEEDETETLDRVVRDRLSPFFGYARGGSGEEPEAGVAVAG